ncbi:MAG: ferritin-like domain-containing protein [Gammaproteobacteria bacterium]
MTDGGPTKQRVAVRTQLEMTHGECAAKTRRVLDTLVDVSSGVARISAPDLASLFGPTFFGLDRTRLFQQAHPHTKAAVLRECTQCLLHEAYFIEKAGIAYCARMVLEAEDTEERQIYSVIGAHEAIHLEWITACLAPSSRPGAPDPFACFLSELIETGDRHSLVYVLQVILEGWGIDHYRSLASNCRLPGVARVFEAVVRDEALHHASGKALFDPGALSESRHSWIEEALASFLHMVRIGPQTVVAVLNRINGGLDLDQRERIFKALDAERTSHTNLMRLKQLIAQPGMESTADRLHESGLFSPCSPRECAAVSPE